MIVAALALPVKNFFQWMLERILFGQRGDPARTVAKLSESLHRESPSLAQTVVIQLADSLRLPFVALEDADGVQLATAGTPAAEAARLPLQVNGVETGWLVAHERAPGEGLDAKDRRLLAMVATHAGLRFGPRACPPTSETVSPAWRPCGRRSAPGCSATSTMNWGRAWPGS